MALEKTTEIVQIEIVNPYKHIQVARDVIVKEDDTEVSRSRQRVVYAPDDDVSSEVQDVKDLADKFWTDEIKASWQSKKEEIANEL
tara:strand:+ start:979 stop:1236 length:258 start_codon:yes stop_codon:yes gene_type:complete